MMQAIRGRAGSIVVKILFGLLIVSFGVLGHLYPVRLFQGTRPTRSSPRSATDSIRADELQRALQPTVERLRAQFGGSDRPAAGEAARHRRLRCSNQLIDRSLLDQEAQRLGLEVSDDVIRNAIYENPAFRGPDGKFDRQLFAQVLMMNRLSEDQLVARLRHDIPRADLLQAVTAGVAATAPGRRRALSLSQRKAGRRHRRLPGRRDHRYRPAERGRADEILRGQSRPVPRPGISRLHAGQPVAERSASRPATSRRTSCGPSTSSARTSSRPPEQRQIQQILAPVRGKGQGSRGGARRRQGLEGGRDDDRRAGSGDDRSRAVEPQGDPARTGRCRVRAAARHSRATPIKTPLGWHILRVVKIEPAATQSFEQAKAADRGRAETAGRRRPPRQDRQPGRRRAGRRRPDRRGRAQIRAQADDGRGGRRERQRPRRASRSRCRSPAAEILKTVFATSAGRHQPHHRYAGRRDLSRCTSTRSSPPQPRPLAEVKDKAVAAWQAEQKQETATKEAEALAAAVKPELPLAKVAGDKGLTLLAGGAAVARPQQGQPVPPALVAKLFAAKPGDVVTASDGDRRLCRAAEGDPGAGRRSPTRRPRRCCSSSPARSSATSPANSPRRCAAASRSRSSTPNSTACSEFRPESRRSPGLRV